MELWLETHATSLDNEARLASGWYDVGLSPTGERQARQLGDRRRDGGFAAVYCSDLRRSYVTAEIAFAGTAMAPVRDARLRECDYGTLTRAPVETIDALREASIEVPFPGGESYADATRRVAEWLADVRRDHPERRVLVIGHRATFYALEHLCNGVPLRVAVTARWKWQPGWGYRA